MRIANSVLDLPSDYRCYGIDDVGGHVEAKVVRDKKAQCCPRCRKGNAVVHGRVKRCVYHRPVKSKPCILVIDLRRYRCKRCGKTFFEPIGIVAECSPHVTVDLEGWIVGQVRLGRSFAEVTRGCGASADIIQKVVDAAPLPKRRLPRHLCVDEFRAFSRRGARMGDTRQFWTAFVDGDTGRLVDVIEGHDRQSVEAWIRSFPKNERERVRFFSCDMFDAFWRAAKAQLPKATICLDKFHVAALVKNAFEDARRRINKRPGKSTAEAKRIWKLLVVDRARLLQPPRARHWQDQAELDAKSAERRKDALAMISDALAGDDENHRELRMAYLMLQAFYAWAGSDFATEGECRQALSRWISQATGCGVREIATAARSIKETKGYVVNAYMTGRTNACAESVNKRIKDVKRRACGFTKCENMRRRLLLAYGFPPLEEGGVPLPNYNE